MKSDRRVILVTGYGAHVAMENRKACANIKWMAAKKALQLPVSI